MKITPEKGYDCTIFNPWPEKSVRVVRNGITADTLTGPRFTLKITVGEIIELNPG